MTTSSCADIQPLQRVVEAYRLDRYDNFSARAASRAATVVEAYRLDRYDNKKIKAILQPQ